MHWSLAVVSVLFVTFTPLRWELGRRLVYQAGQGSEAERAKEDEIQGRGPADYFLFLILRVL